MCMSATTPSLIIVIKYMIYEKKRIDSSCHIQWISLQLIILVNLNFMCFLLDSYRIDINLFSESPWSNTFIHIYILYLISMWPLSISMCSLYQLDSYDNEVVLFMIDIAWQKNHFDEIYTIRNWTHNQMSFRRPNYERSMIFFMLILL